LGLKKEIIQFPPSSPPSRVGHLRAAVNVFGTNEINVFKSPIDPVWELYYNYKIQQGGKAAWQISGPIPSPSIKGIIGSSGTLRPLFVICI